jgi:hypothetical protein
VQPHSQKLFGVLSRHASREGRDRGMSVRSTILMSCCSASSSETNLEPLCLNGRNNGSNLDVWPSGNGVAIHGNAYALAVQIGARFAAPKRAGGSGRRDGCSGKDGRTGVRRVGVGYGLGRGETAAVVRRNVSTNTGVKIVTFTSEMLKVPDRAAGGQ